MTDLREHGRIILAHGEVTHHAHEVVVADTGLPPDIAAAQFFETATGRELVVLADGLCLRHGSVHHWTAETADHSAIALVREEARRGATGDRDATGRLYGQYRQGDVLLRPTGLGTWRVIQQQEMYRPAEWRRVAD